MADIKKTARMRFLVAISFLVMIAANVLAVVLPINGLTPGEVSDSYPNLFAPAGVTFSIWGLIYTLLTCFSLFALGAFHPDRRKAVLIREMSLYFSISSFVNAAWIFSWHFRIIPLSMLFMLLLLACLIILTSQTRRQVLSPKERFLLKLPFSIYLGWITVATCANLTVLLVSLGFDMLGTAGLIWTVGLLAAALIVTVLVIVRTRDIAYGLVIIWAYSGILLKHTSASGFDGSYPVVIYTVIAALAVLFAAELLVLIKLTRSR